MRTIDTQEHVIAADDAWPRIQHANVNSLPVPVDIAPTAWRHFAEPNSSWWRGANDSANGLIRRYLPKRRFLSVYADAGIQTIEGKFNQHSQKHLDFRAPQRVVDISFNRDAHRR